MDRVMRILFALLGAGLVHTLHPSATLGDLHVRTLHRRIRVEKMAFVRPSRLPIQNVVARETNTSVPATNVSPRLSVAQETNTSWLVAQACRSIYSSCSKAIVNHIRELLNKFPKPPWLRVGYALAAPSCSLVCMIVAYSSIEKLFRAAAAFVTAKDAMIQSHFLKGLVHRLPSSLALFMAWLTPDLLLPKQIYRGMKVARLQRGRVLESLAMVQRGVLGIVPALVKNLIAQFSQGIEQIRMLQNTSTPAPACANLSLASDKTPMISKIHLPKRLKIKEVEIGMKSWFKQNGRYIIRRLPSKLNVARKILRWQFVILSIVYMLHPTWRMDISWIPFAEPASISPQVEAGRGWFSSTGSAHIPLPLKSELRDFLQTWIRLEVRGKGLLWWLVKLDSIAFTAWVTLVPGLGLLLKPLSLALSLKSLDASFHEVSDRQVPIAVLVLAWFTGGLDEPLKIFKYISSHMRDAPGMLKKLFNSLCATLCKIPRRVWHERQGVFVAGWKIMQWDLAFLLIARVVNPEIGLATSQLARHCFFFSLWLWACVATLWPAISRTEAGFVTISDPLYLLQSAFAVFFVFGFPLDFEKRASFCFALFTKFLNEISFA